MTHGRTEKTKINARKERNDTLLTAISEQATESLEGRLARLEARFADLEERVDRASGVVPSHFFGGPEDIGKKTPGPHKSIDDTELFHNRDALVHWLEESWPKIVKPFLAAHSPSDVAEALRQVARTADLRPPWENRFIENSVQLFAFLRSDKFRIKPPKKTVVDALRLFDAEKRTRAANRLPTRQIANAMAGVPKLKWRTSLDKCSKNPSSSRVNQNTERYYRAMFGIPEDKSG